MKNVAIYGIGGLYNFGCEAILRGTVEYIRKTYGDDANITYYSRNIGEESKIAKSMGIKIVDISRKMNFIRKIISKAIDVLEIPVTPFFRNEFNKIINNSDVIVSVGGDIYTIPNYLREKKKYRYVNYLVEFGEKALKKDKNIIIYGASIGPFGQYEKASNYYIDHLKKVNQIICREMESVKYLRSKGVIDNVIFLPDPAFLVENSNRKKDLKYIGINLSELSLTETYGKVSERELNSICNLLNELARTIGLPLMLIPHVLSPYTPMDNDFIFLGKIYSKLADDVKATTVLVKPESFLDAKQYLIQCKFIISARMHCALNAIIEGIPSVFLSYSQKSNGMSCFVYGDDCLSVPMQQMETKLISTVNKLVENYDDVKLHLENRILEIQNIYNDYFENYR